MTTEIQKAEPQAIQQATPTPADLIKIAIAKDVDVEKLDKLMEMQLRWEANEAKKAYVQAMADFRAQCPQIVKTQTVSFSNTHYTHASLGGTIEQIKDLLTQCGLSHSWRTQNAPGQPIGVSCVITHAQGHSEETTLSAAPDTSGAKNPIQAIGSAVSYLQRYTLFAMLGLASASDDDGASTRPAAAPLSRSRSNAAPPPQEPPQEAQTPADAPPVQETPQSETQAPTNGDAKRRFAAEVLVLAADAGIIQVGDKLSPDEYKGILMQSMALGGCNTIEDATAWMVANAKSIIRDENGIRLVAA